MADVSVKCSRCKDSIAIGLEETTLIVDGDGGFLCEQCNDLEKDLITALAPIIAKHSIGRLVKSIKSHRCITCNIPLDPRCTGCYSCDDCEVKREVE